MAMKPESFEWLDIVREVKRAKQEISAESLRRALRLLRDGESRDNAEEMIKSSYVNRR